MSGYLVAVASVVLATWLKYLAQPTIIPADVPILYMLAIVPTAVFFGIGPAILVCVLSLLAYDFYFMLPLHAFKTLSEIRNVPILLIFLLVGLLFSYLASDLRRKNEASVKEIAARKKANEELEKEVSKRKQAEKVLQDLNKVWISV